MEVVEQYADGLATDRSLQDAYRSAWTVWHHSLHASFCAAALASATRAACMGAADPTRHNDRSRCIDILLATHYAIDNAAQSVAFLATPIALQSERVSRIRYTYPAEGLKFGVGFYTFEVDDSGWVAALASERRNQCRLLQDLFFNPFRPTVVMGVPGGTPAQLARAVYEGRRSPEGTLEPARLALLADALEDAGCTDADLLGHLRGPGPHVRGCWAVDLALGKS